MVLVCKEFVSINVISLSDGVGVIWTWLGVAEERNERRNETAKHSPCIVEDSGLCDGFGHSQRKRGRSKATEQRGQGSKVTGDRFQRK